MRTQVLKGIVEVYVLAQLRKKESYGYEIVLNLANYIEISESTLYPILRRLEEAKELETYNVIHNGRNRKYYRINKKGINHIDEFLVIWDEVMDTYQKIVER